MCEEMSRECYAHQIQRCQSALHTINLLGTMVRGSAEDWACRELEKRFLPDLMRLSQQTSFRPMDDEHHVWQCGNCGTLWPFEADGPFENGWNRCPKCGLLIKPPVEVDVN